MAASSEVACLGEGACREGEAFQVAPFQAVPFLVEAPFLVEEAFQGGAHSSGRMAVVRKVLEDLLEVPAYLEGEALSFPVGALYFRKVGALGTSAVGLCHRVVEVPSA